MRGQETPDPVVIRHIMKDGTIRTSLKGYLTDFRDLPDNAQRIIRAWLTQ